MESSDEFVGLEDESSREAEANTQSNEENREDFVGDDEDDENNENATKKRAPIWNHFSEVVDEQGRRYAMCKHTPCTTKYLVSGKSNVSTGNMIKHIDRKHPKIYRVDNPQDEEAFIFSQDKFRQALLKWVVMCDQPFSAPKDQAFVDLVNTLNPLAHIVCDKTIRADLMVEYDKQIEELKTELAAVPGKISITLDGWTSKHGLPFLAIRGHWTDDQWQLQSKLLDFAYIDGNHDGQNHSVILAECLRRLHVPFSNILAITADNAGSNNTLFDWLDNYGISAVTSQVRCLAHVINLAAQDMLEALKVPSHSDPEYDELLENEVVEDIDLNEDIDNEELQEEAEEATASNMVVTVKMRTLIKKIRKSTKLRQKLQKLCIMYNVKYLVPIIDVKTRWNSTFHMIVRSEHLMIPLKYLCLHEKALGHLRITSTEWSELRKIKIVLVKFDRATKLISWKAHTATFPSLANMARDYFAVQSGSVCVERDFAGAVDVITPTRCSLIHSTIRAVMCVKSWYKS